MRVSKFSTKWKRIIADALAGKKRTLVTKDLLSSTEGSLAIFNWLVEWILLDGTKAIEHAKSVAKVADRRYMVTRCRSEYYDT
jgi:hypothetical protein